MKSPRDIGPARQIALSIRLKSISRVANRLLETATIMNHIPRLRSRPVRKSSVVKVISKTAIGKYIATTTARPGVTSNRVINGFAIPTHATSDAPIVTVTPSTMSRRLTSVRRARRATPNKATRIDPTTTSVIADPQVSMFA